MGWYGSKLTIGIANFKALPVCSMGCISPEIDTGEILSKILLKLLLGPHSVKQKEPNAWGLYDMHGNLAEWCFDWYNIGYYTESPKNDPIGPENGLCRVVRGGSWYHLPEHNRSAVRGYNAPDSQHCNQGFRIILTEQGR